MEIDFVGLSKTAGIEEDRVKGVWNDFKREVQRCFEGEVEFIYPDLAEITARPSRFGSKYIVDVVDKGEGVVEEFTKDLDDQRKIDFARIVYYIIHHAFHGPAYFEGIGTFYLRGKMTTMVKHPQTGERTMVPQQIALGFVADVPGNERWRALK